MHADKCTILFSKSFPVDVEQQPHRNQHASLPVEGLLVEVDARLTCPDHVICSKVDRIEDQLELQCTQNPSSDNTQALLDLPAREYAVDDPAQGRLYT